MITRPPPPIRCIWDGEHFVPHNPFWARRADEYFVVGEIYPLEVREDRSSQSQAHYFAALNEAWANLPERLGQKFPTAEHLRKFALIQCGYRDERAIACPSETEAHRMAVFIKPLDDFAIITAAEKLVVIWTAKSQSYRAMRKEEFTRSKQAVLDYVASLVGVTTQALTDNTGGAA